MFQSFARHLLDTDNGCSPAKRILHLPFVHGMHCFRNIISQLSTFQNLESDAKKMLRIIEQKITTLEKKSFVTVSTFAFPVFPLFDASILCPLVSKKVEHHSTFNLGFDDILFYALKTDIGPNHE